MLQLTKQGDELMALAVNTEEQLREKGHEVVCKPTSDVAAFEILRETDEELLAKVQAVGEETFEIVRTSGETLSGFGGDPVMIHMLDRVLTDLNKRAA